MVKIHEHEGCSLKKLSEIVAIDKANTTRNVKKLESLGYISIKTCQTDKRAKKIYLSPSGQQLIPTIKKRLQQVTSVLTESLTDDEACMLSNLLIKAESSIIRAVQDRKEAK